jgi:hypothetical protein
MRKGPDQRKTIGAQAIATEAVRGKAAGEYVEGRRSDPPGSPKKGEPKRAAGGKEIEAGSAEGLAVNY